MKRSISLFLGAVATLALPLSASAQAANHVSWGIGTSHGSVWNPFVATAAHGSTFFGVGHGAFSISFGTELWAYDLGRCGWDHAHSHYGHEYCGAYGHAHQGCGQAPWSWNHSDHWGVHPDCFDYRLGSGRYGPRGYFGRLAWTWPPAFALAWPWWRLDPFAHFVHPAFLVQPRADFWYGAGYWTEPGFSFHGLRRGGTVVAGRGYRGPDRPEWDRRRWDRPVRRSPLFGPRYKEDPRVYVTDNGPQRPTSRVAPRVRYGERARPAPTTSRTGASDAIRKAKPRNPGATGRIAPRPGQRGSAVRAAGRADEAGAARTRRAARPRPPSARPASRSAPPAAKPATRNARPKARSTKSAPPKARPATRSAPPKPRPAARGGRAKPKTATKPAPARAKPKAIPRRPPKPRRPAKRGGA